jgi:hypothetical protein
LGHTKIFLSFHNREKNYSLPGGAVTGALVVGCEMAGATVTGEPVRGAAVTGEDVTGDAVTGIELWGGPVTGCADTGGSGADVTGGLVTTETNKSIDEKSSKVPW